MRFRPCFALALACLLLPNIFALTSITVCAYNATVAGETYQLTGDLPCSGSFGVNITAANVILDCKGFSIIGANASASYGVYTKAAGVTVKNCQISNFSTDMYLTSSSSASIQNNTLSVSFNSSGYGIQIGSNSNNVNLTKNTIYSTNSGYGISVGSQNTTLDCQGASITGSLSASSTGVYSTQTNTTVMNCNISNFKIGIQYSSAKSGTIVNNIFNQTYGSGGDDIYLSGSTYIVVANNTMNDAVATNIGTASSEGNNTFINNTITNSRSGSTAYSLTGTSGNDFVDCRGANLSGPNSSSSYGFYSTQTNSTVINCRMAGFSSGIYLAAGANCTSAANNTISISYSAGSAVKIAANANNSLIYNNSITGPVWVTDSGTANSYNTSSIGNIYYFANGTASWQVYNITASSGTWADGGADRPFESFLLEWNGAGQDYHPYTSKSGVADGPYQHCGPLSNANTVYTLTQDYSVYTENCFNVTAPNITLDCAGHSISGANVTSTYGVYTTQLNTTVKNCHINNFDAGIYLYGSVNSTVANNTITLTANGSASNGIYLRNSAQYNVVANNTVSANAGIWLSHVGNQSNNQFLNNTLYSPPLFGEYGYYEDSGGTNNTMDCQGAPITGSNSSTGALVSGTNSTIKNCPISNFSTGIALSGAISANISRNTISIASYGFAISSSTNPMIKDCSISNVTLGFYLISMNSAIIVNNTINAVINSSITATAIRSTANVNNSLFYENNMTAEEWVYDLGNNNSYNYTLPNGTNVGNIYYFANGIGSWKVFSITSNSSPNWADGGFARPFNTTSVGPYWPDNGADWYPYTENSPKERPPAPIWGVMHSIHSTFSDGTLSPEQRMIALKSNLDWASTSDHYPDLLTQEEWNATANAADGNNSSSFILFSGYEETVFSPTNHRHVIFEGDAPRPLPSNITNRSNLAPFLAANNGLASMAHTADPTTSDLTDPTNFNETYIPLIEIYNSGPTHDVQGMWNNYYNCSPGVCTTWYNPAAGKINNSIGWVKVALDGGHHLGFSGATDYHGDLPYIPDTFIGIVGADWSRESVFNALKNRHTWVAQNRTYMSVVADNGTPQVMGDIFTINTSSIVINYTINATQGTTIGNVSLMDDGSIVSFRNYSGQNVSDSIVLNLSDSKEHYVFAVAIQSDGNYAWSSPMYITSVGICRTLDVANSVETLLENMTIENSTCFPVAADNVTLNCNGYSINGNNAVGTYGIYSDQNNLTLEYCPVRGFPHTMHLGPNSIVLNSITDNRSISISGSQNISVSDSSVDFSSIAVNSSGTITATLNGSINITSRTSLGEMTMQIPDSESILASSDWDGLMNLPIFSTSASITIPTESGFTTPSTSIAIEVGDPNLRLNFTSPVRLVISGHAGQYAGYITGRTFYKITKACSADSASSAVTDLAGTYGECKIDTGADMVIWTKHFSQFVAYTQSAVCQGCDCPGACYSSTGGGEIRPVSKTIDTPAKPPVKEDNPIVVETPVTPKPEPVNPTPEKPVTPNTPPEEQTPSTPSVSSEPLVIPMPSMPTQKDLGIWPVLAWGVALIGLVGVGALVVFRGIKKR